MLRDALARKMHTVFLEVPQTTCVPYNHIPDQCLYVEIAFLLCAQLKTNDSMPVADSQILRYSDGEICRRA